MINNSISNKNITTCLNLDMNYFSKSLYKSNGYLRQSISSTINYLSITSTTINQVRYNSNSSRSKDRHRDNSSRKNTTNSNKKRLDQSTSKQNDSYKLFKGIKVLPENDIFKENIGEELAGKLEKSTFEFDTFFLSSFN